MSSPTNLTGRLTHLRQQKKVERVSRTRPPKKARRPKSERKMAHDPFLILAYSLMAASVIAQFCLILWLDVL